MSSGLLVLDTKGTAQYMNPGAEEILGTDVSALSGKPIVRAFFMYEENDLFVQLILDAVYNKNSTQEGIVPFSNGETVRTLRLKTSYLYREGECVGIICMMDDITELYELKDAVKAMNEIKRLNDSLTLRNSLLTTTFGRFLSDDIVKKLIDTEDGLKLGGDKREVTVMMSDLRGFTALSESMSAFNLVTMLNHYLGTMTEIIQKNHGTIIEFIGDGIMALFGAPEWYEDHADMAVCAAVSMQAAMKEVNEWNAANGFPELLMGIGLHTGDAIIGNIGSEQRTKYGAVGSNINLAGRIESYTTGGQILASENTVNRMKAVPELGSSLSILPKGAKKELAIHGIVGVGEPYNLSIKGLFEAEPVSDIPEPVPCGFERLKGKFMEPDLCTGTVLAVSKDLILITTEEDLKVYENICFKAEGNLYAKVTEERKGGFICRFTSKPAGFDGWLSKLKNV